MLTTYADLGTEQIEGADHLVLGAGSGLDRTLEEASARLEAGSGLVLEVAHEAGGAALRSLLGRHPHIGVVGARPVHQGWVVELGVRTAVATEGLLDVLLDVLDSTAVPDRTSAAAAEEPSQPSPRPVAAPTPARRGILAQHVGRRSVLLLGGSGAVLLAALVVVLGVTAGIDAAETGLLAVLVLLQVVLVALVLLALTAVRQVRGDQAPFDHRLRTLVAKRTDRLRTQTDLIRGDLEALPFLRDYLIELGKLQSETSARLEELSARLQERR